MDSRGWKIMNMGRQSTNSPNKKKQSPGHDSDSSSSSSLGLYDSDVDKEFLPNEETSTDSDEHTSAKVVRKPSKFKVGRNKNTNNAKRKQNDNAVSTQENYQHLRGEEILVDSVNASPNYEEEQVDDSAHYYEDEHIVNPITSNGEEPVNEQIETGKKRKVKSKTVIKQRGRKRVRHEESWLCNVPKRKSLKGEAYVNKKGKKIQAKSLKPPCMCRMKCYEKISDEERQHIFNSYWSDQSSSDVKRQFITACVLQAPVERTRNRDVDSGRSKEHTLSYNLNNCGNRVNVCKVMFLNTLCMSNKVVFNMFKNLQPGGIFKPDKRGKHTPPNKTPAAVIDSVINHISSFPYYECHYSREKTKRKYLGTDLNIEKMCELYVGHCRENNTLEEIVAKNWVYRDIFNKRFDLSFKPPEVDTCDTCDSYQAKLKGSLSQLEREPIQAEYNAHLKESKRRYDLKAEDSKIANENSSHKVLTGDLQKCLATPLITSGLSFYKRKLWTLNFTIYDASDSTVHCLMRDETKGARGGNEIASAILKWADDVIPGSNVQEITLWTDNCYGQNKNKSMIMCFFWLMKKYPQIKVIIQKFLLKGHTHMEADTVHTL